MLLSTRRQQLPLQLQIITIVVHVSEPVSCYTIKTIVRLRSNFVFSGVDSSKHDVFSYAPRAIGDEIYESVSELFLWRRIDAFMVQ